MLVRTFPVANSYFHAQGDEAMGAIRPLPVFILLDSWEWVMHAVKSAAALCISCFGTPMGVILVYALRQRPWDGQGSCRNSRRYHSNLIEAYTWEPHNKAWGYTKKLRCSETAAISPFLEVNRWSRDCRPMVVCPILFSIPLLSLSKKVNICPDIFC